MASPPNPNLDPKPAGRAFVRSLNILLKYSRLYGPAHQRTRYQFDAAWHDFHIAQESEGSTGLMLGVSGTELLVDGVPLGCGTAERSLADLMQGAGVASIHLLPLVTADEFGALVEAIIASAKSKDLAQRWKAETDNAGNVRINQVRFVAHAEDEQMPTGSFVPAIAAQSLSDRAHELQNLMSDPHKLLQVIAAAVGVNKVSGQNSVGSAPSTNGSSGPPEQKSPVVAQESDLVSIIQMLSGLGQAKEGTQGTAAGAVKKMTELPASAQEAFKSALADITKSEFSDREHPMLLQVAEHLAIRFALDRFERGEVRVNAVREMLDRMGREMGALRQVLQSHEQEMRRAGLAVEDHAEVLDRQFWAAVPEKGKRGVLLSPDAWCIPARNVVVYVKELLERNDQKAAEEILLSYVDCIRSHEREARLKTAAGLCSMVEVLGSAPQVLQECLEMVGEQLANETDPEMQKTLSATFVRLSHEAVRRRQFNAVQQALASTEAIEARLPEMAAHLRPRLGLHDRLPEFVNEALASEQPSAELLEMLRCVPNEAAGKFMQQFDLSSRRETCERIIHLMQQLGPAAVAYLREQLSVQPAESAVLTIAMLSRLDLRSLEQALPKRIRSWNRFHQDMALRQLSAGDAPERGRLLLKLVDYVDTLLLPQLVDEIGMSGDRQASSRLMNLAFDDAHGDNDYLQLKAIEALGRLQEKKAEGHLRVLITAKQRWNWKHPREIRIASAQALVMMNADAPRQYMNSNGFTAEELALAPLNPNAERAWARHRRYARFTPPQEISASITTPRESDVKVVRLSMGGGLAQAECGSMPGTVAPMELRVGFSRIRAQVWLRQEQHNNMSFEILAMGLDERNKLRRLLTGDLSSRPAQLFEMQIANPMRAMMREHRTHA